MGDIVPRLLGSPKNMFKRPEENILMLEQYLADLEARYVLLADGSKSEGSAG